MKTESDSIVNSIFVGGKFGRKIDRQFWCQETSVVSVGHVFFILIAVVSFKTCLTVQFHTLSCLLL